MTNKLFRSVSLLVCLSMILSLAPLSPQVGLAENVSDDSSVQLVPLGVEEDIDVLSPHWLLPRTLPVVETARQMVAAQVAHTEPTPVPIGTPLPPGTVGSQKHFFLDIYLPIIIRGDSGRNANQPLAVQSFDLVCDDGQGCFSYNGIWNTPANPNQYCKYANDMRFGFSCYFEADCLSNNDLYSVFWRPYQVSGFRSGRYQVYAYISRCDSLDPHTQSAKYYLRQTGDSAATAPLMASVNQRHPYQDNNDCSDSARWASLGTHDFNSSTYVELRAWTDESTPGTKSTVIFADAIKFTFVNQAPNTPNLTSPADGTVTANSAVSLQIQDTGDPDNYPNASRTFDYRIEKTDATWSQNNNGTASTSWALTLPSLGEYRWRARSYDGALYSAWSAWRYVTLTIDDPVRLSASLTLTPNELDHPGGQVCVSFAAKNYGSVTAPAQKFRAFVHDSTVTFGVTGDVTLSTGQAYSYSDCKTFSQTGIYRVVAEHFVGGGWTPLITEGFTGSGYIQVKAPQPPKSQQKKGASPTCGYAGEPVNTVTGNYFYDFTDLTEPTPGLPLVATRWYNALDATDVDGPFGYGTSWTYNMTATLRADKSAIVRMADGHLAYFLGEIDPADPTNLDGVYDGQEEEHGTLERSGDTAVLTTPDQTDYHFDATGRLTHVTHPYPAEIIVVYSGTLPTQLIHLAGMTYTLTYSGSNITHIASSSGRAVTYTYTISDNLAAVTRPDGSTYTYTYDENHRLTEARDPNNHAFVRNIYDDEGRVTHQYDQTDQESTFSYGATITGTRNFTDVLGNTITHTYDSDYRLIREMDALGYTTVYTRDADGNVIARHDKDGSVWHYAFDERGNTLSETDPLGSTWTYTYDEHNNRTSQTDPLGHIWTYEYDANDRLIRTTDPLLHTREYDYDAQGNLIWEQDENGAETWYAYNELGLQTAITDSIGNVTRMGYDSFGNQTVYTDAKISVATFVYDGLNRLVESTDPVSAVITFTYDLMGNLLTESDGMGHLKHYTYNEYDRIVAETDFNGNTTHYGFDALGRRTVVTDAVGHTTVYTYNGVGQLVARQDKKGAVTRYEYDPAGRLIRETDALSRTTEYVYDAAGRQVEVHRPCDACDGGVAVSYTVYNAAGQVIEEIDPRGANTRYGHDIVGRLAVVTDTYGYTRTYTYDPTGRVIQETDPASAISSYEHDTLGQIITTTNAMGYQTFTRYDAVGLPVQTVNERGYTTTMIYDANDQVIATIDALGNVTQNAYDEAGRLIASTDPLSRTTTYRYDPNGNQIAVTDALSHTRRTEYDALNRPVRRIDPQGNVSTTTYDEVGRVVAETNALSQTRVITYDVVGRKIAERSPLGYTTVYTYDSADNLIARQEPSGAVWRYEFDPNGNQIRQIDSLGNVGETEYDLLNRAVHETDPLGAITGREYDGAGQLIARTGPRGATTHYEHDLLGRTVRETTPLGHTRVYTHDGAGNRVAEQNERGFVTTYVHDALNRQVAQTDPLGHTRYTLHDAAGQVEAEVDYNGNPTSYIHDLVGNQVQVTNALSGTTTTAYNALNQPIAVTDELNQTRRTGYNVLGQVVSQTTPLGYTTVYTYNAEGWRIARADAMDGVWTTTHDEAGRPVRETDPLGRVNVTMYDLLGHVIARTDALSRTTHYEYDPTGRLLAVIGPDGTTQRYTYDPAGNILTEADGNGHVTRYEYNLEGRLVLKTGPLNNRWRYRYDPAGNQIETITPAGHSIAQAHDPLGRLARKLYDGAETVSFAHDPNGNRAAMTGTLGVSVYVYDGLNQLVASTDPAGRVVEYGYDTAGQRVTITYPDAVSTANYGYDADGNLQSVTAPDGGVTAYERDPLGRPMRVAQANGVVVETVYDAVGNTLSITQRDAGGAIFAQHTYIVDGADRRVTKTETLPQGAVTTAYTYSDLDQLMSSIASDGRKTHYTFDGAGNRIAMWGTRARNAITETYQVDYAYNAANQLQQAIDSATGATVYFYDADGNRTGSRSTTRRVDYVYDAESRLTEARVEEWDGARWAYKDGITERYAYDGSGRRVHKETISANLGTVINRREYRYDDTREWDVLQTYNVAVTTTETRYLYDQSLHKLAYWQDGDAGYFQNDGLGSVLGATDGNGDLAASEGLMRYGDYGEELGPEDVLPTDDGFTGYEREAYTGLDYARNRYYDPATGTFLTIDPFSVDREDMLNLHRYLYVQANPLNMTDPLGLFNWDTQIVEKGDTLWDIAMAWGTTVDELMHHNPQIKSRNRIYPGQQISLPKCQSAKCNATHKQEVYSNSGKSGTDCGEGYRSSSSLPLVVPTSGTSVRSDPKQVFNSFALLNSTNDIPSINQLELWPFCGTPSNSCGPTALTAVLCSYCIDCRPSPYLTLCQITRSITSAGKDYRNIFNLRDKFNALAIRADASVTAEHFRKNSDTWLHFLWGQTIRRRPVVVLWTKPGHYVVVIRVSSTNIRIMNPLGGQFENYSPEDFQNMWSETTEAAKSYQGIAFSESVPSGGWSSCPKVSGKFKWKFK
ncbi:MAG: LysM peptidoglycan-binding domain-containing protein [Chloroflexi bacterium]|nr:LysM peptidoglycan-binding domain-containing protein [Chloroflexota bacterium]